MLKLLIVGSSLGVASGWGTLGHEMVANVAYQRLTHQTRNAVLEILGPTNGTDEAGSALAAKYLRSGVKAMALDLGGAGLSAEEAAAVLIGLRLRSWRHDIYRTTLAEEKKATLASVTVTAAPEGTEAAWEIQAAIAEGSEFTRMLVAEPANKVYPISFVEKCEEAFAGTGAELTVLDEDQMAELGMGALLGVGQGSRQPSRLLAIRWIGGGDEAPTVFVGKGVTFDTGGISLKPPGGMEDMKWDMGRRWRSGRGHARSRQTQSQSQCRRRCRPCREHA